MTQNNLGLALATFGEREGGTAQLEQAVKVLDACLPVISAVWPFEWVDDVRARKDGYGPKSDGEFQNNLLMQKSRLLQRTLARALPMG